MPDRTIAGALGAIAFNLLIGSPWGPAPAGAFCWQPTEGDPTSGEQCPTATVCVEWLDGDNVGAVECCDSPPNCEIGCPTGTGIRPTLILLDDDVAFAQRDSLSQDLKHGAVEIRHAVPKIPLVIDHVPYSPEGIGSFDGVPLHFLMCRSTIEESVLYAFTSRAEMVEQAKSCTIRSPSMVVREASSKGGTGIVFYDDERWGGASYSLSQGQRLELDGTWWNNRVSSVRGFGLGTAVTFYENSPGAGSSLTLATDLSWPSLEFFGWGNRASAVSVWSVRPAKPLF